MARRAGCRRLVVRRCPARTSCRRRRVGQTPRDRSSSTSADTRCSFGQNHVAPRSKRWCPEATDSSRPPTRLRDSSTTTERPAACSRPAARSPAGPGADDDNVGSRRLAHDSSVSVQAGRREAAGSVIESIVSTAVGFRAAFEGECCNRSAAASDDMVDGDRRGAISERDLDTDGLCRIAGRADSESARSDLADRRAVGDRIVRVQQHPTRCRRQPRTRAPGDR